jgi:hypothetical protein
LAIPNPEHLLEQADRLIGAGSPGQPRQVDLRRAISAAYYAVFHSTLAAAADRYVGANRRATGQYSLAYRSVDHKEFRDICSRISIPNFSGRLSQYLPAAIFDANIRTFAQAVLELQAKRIDADYNPAIRERKADAELAVGTAREALRRLQAANSSSREAFPALLLFKVR